MTSDKTLRIGLAGIGFMGWIHWLAYQKVSGVQVAAVCSRDEKKLAGDWRDIKGNFGPPGEQVDLAAVKKYRTLEEMLADPDIDVVDLCLPPGLHASAAIQALQAGKHVLVEKPMALTTDECDQMVAAAKAAGKQLFVAHVLPFLPEYTYALEVIKSQQYGRPIGGTFKRVISDPLWIKDFYDPRGAGGPLVDLHVHDAHFIRTVFGMPTAVFSQGRLRGDVVEYCNSLFQFADSRLAVAATSGVLHQQGRGFTHGYELHLEQATLHFEIGFYADGVTDSMPLKVLLPDGTVQRPTFQVDGDPMLVAFEREIAEVAQCVGQQQASGLLGADLARDAIALCHLQTQSVQQRKQILA
jgi:predicted dehydrogenase